MKTNACDVEIGLCAQNTNTILSSVMSTMGRAYVIICRDRESSLEPLTFAFQISLLKLEMILYISRGLFG